MSSDRLVLTTWPFSANEGSPDDLLKFVTSDGASHLYVLNRPFTAHEIATIDRWYHRIGALAIEAPQVRGRSLFLSTYEFASESCLLNSEWYEATVARLLDAIRSISTLGAIESWNGEYRGHIFVSKGAGEWSKSNGTLCSFDHGGTYVVPG